MLQGPPASSQCKTGYWRAGIQFAAALRLYDPATGKDLGPAKGAKVDIVGHSSPALVDGRLVVNAGTHLRCYDLAKH